MAEVVAGTGDVDGGGGGATPVLVREDVERWVFAEPLVADVLGAGWALPPPPEETITATIAPVTAATARPPSSRAFLTKPEATLAAG